MKTALVAGHICLDVLPDLGHIQPGQFLELFQPGHLIETGPALFATGGPVSNTGLALHKLGVPTRLIAKVGQDFFGEIVRSLIGHINPRLVEGISASAGTHTSYSVVINPPGMDRIFLHSPGANDRFTDADIDYRLVAQTDLFHFGYPPIMRAMYSDGGAVLERVFRRAKEAGATTTLDMTFPDPTSESGRADWTAILRRVLPYVDLFLPSIDEILFMLRREQYEQMMTQGGVLASLNEPFLADLSVELIRMGAKAAGIKLGERGFYLRTAADLSGMGRAAPSDLALWQEKTIHAPCFQVNVVGTTGSGDATIAGFLAALLRDLPAEQAAEMAVAVGACNVEAPDALSGIRTWEETTARVAHGWERLQLN